MITNLDFEHRSLYVLHLFVTVPCGLSALKIAGLQANKWEVESMLLSAVWILNHSVFSVCFYCLSEHGIFFRSFGIAEERTKMMMKR